MSFGGGSGPEAFAKSKLALHYALTWAWKETVHDGGNAYAGDLKDEVMRAFPGWSGGGAAPAEGS